MKVQIKLDSPSDRIVDIVNVENVTNINNFAYLDNENNKCHISIYDEGLVLLKQCKEYYLDLHLLDPCYALIKTKEGNLKFDTKVVDFSKNNDILVMRYIIDTDERSIVIRYEGDSK